MNHKTVEGRESCVSCQNKKPVKTRDCLCFCLTDPRPETHDPRLPLPLPFTFPLFLPAQPAQMLLKPLVYFFDGRILANKVIGPMCNRSGHGICIGMRR